MTPQELKNSILQLAIQGKLVEQRPEEGTGEELYRQIQAEKQKLIREGKIKKEKPLPDIAEDEVPFDIPENWKWVRMSSVISLLSGSDLTPDKYNSREKGIPYITGASNIENGIVTINRWTDRPTNIAFKGDLLLTCKGTVGKTAILQEDKAHIARQIMALTPIVIDTVFIKYFTEAQTLFLKSRAKSMIPGIERNSILNLAFPLPPLAEQKRIVAKIEELLPLIDRYEKAWGRLEEFNRQFPADMQKSLLQMAIQGKLVEQRPEEGTGEELYRQIQAEKQRLIKEGKIKKEKPLPDIAEDEVPFEIPESWKWVRLGDIILSAKDGPHFSPKYQPSGIPFISTRNISTGKLDFTGAKYISEELHQELCKRCKPKQWDVLYSKGGTTGIAAVNDTDVDFNVWVHVAVLELGDYLFPFYLATALNSPHCYDQSQKLTHGTSNRDLGLTRMINISLPLPPLAEQKRIVAKLEELLPLCKRLK